MTGRNEEGILHVPCGMVPGKIEGFENMIVIFNFRSFGYIIPEFAENIDDFLPDN